MNNTGYISLRFFFSVLLLFIINYPALAASISVTSTADTVTNDGNCTLREAILAANTNSAIDNCAAGSGTDSITINVVGDIFLTADLPVITESLNIYGKGLSSQIHGSDTYRVFYFESTSLLPTPVSSLNNLIILGGYSASFGSGAVTIRRGNLVYLNGVTLADNTSNSGGGVYLENATDENDRAGLYMNYSNIENNTATGPAGGGGIRAGHGSLVYIIGSSVVRNKASHINGQGGGINISSNTLDSALLLINSTVTLNTAAANGGGIAISGSTQGVTADIKNATITGNIANIDNSAEPGAGWGGGIYIGSSSAVTIEGSIISGNLALPSLSDIRLVVSLSPSELISSGYNLIGVNSYAEDVFPAGQPNANHDFVGTSTSSLNGAANLGTLTGDSTTRTEFIPLLSVSIAIDKAGQCELETDQIGQPRSKCKCDIGAYEAAESSPDNSSCESDLFFIPLPNGKTVIFDL